MAFALAAVPAPVAVNETNASCAIKISGRSFVTAANDQWALGGGVVTRPNRSRVIRLTNWTATVLQLRAIGTNGGQPGNLACIVNGALFSTIAVPLTAIPQDVTISGLPAGSKTVEIWEDFQQRNAPLDNYADSAVGGTYVTHVYVAPGAGTFARASATTGVVTIGDSQHDGNAATPWQWNGWAGQLRQIAHNAGWLFSYLAYGSKTIAGDGPTPSDTAQMIHDLWVAMGCTVKKLLWFTRPNDYAYVAFGGTTTPALLATYAGAMCDALVALGNTFTVDLVTSIPQGTGQSGANGLGFTLADYRTAVAGVATGRSYITVRDGSTVFGLSLAAAADYAEADPNEVHLGTGGANGNSGHNKVATTIRGWWGI